MGFFSSLKNTFESARRLWQKADVASIFSRASEPAAPAGPQIFDPNFHGASFDRRVTDALDRAKIRNAVSASGVFRFSPEEAENLQRTLNFQGNFSEATIVMTHSEDGRAAAYMVGRRHDSHQLDVIALHNIAKPNDRGFHDIDSANGSVEYFNIVFSLHATPVREMAAISYAVSDRQDAISMVPSRGAGVNAGVRQPACA